VAWSNCHGFRSRLARAGGQAADLVAERTRAAEHDHVVGVESVGFYFDGSGNASGTGSSTGARKAGAESASAKFTPVARRGQVTPWFSAAFCSLRWTSVVVGKLSAFKTVSASLKSAKSCASGLVVIVWSSSTLSAAKGASRSAELNAPEANLLSGVSPAVTRALFATVRSWSKYATCGTDRLAA